LSVAVPGALIDAVLKPAVTPAGWPLTDSVIGAVKPPDTLLDNVRLPLAPAVTDKLPALAAKEKAGTDVGDPNSAAIKPAPFGLPQPVARS
jgi:hypothetical protein